MPNNDATVTVTSPDPIIATPTPKVDGKFKTALKHPIATAKAHKTFVAVVVGAALGTVATLLLTTEVEASVGQIQLKSDDEIELLD